MEDKSPRFRVLFLCTGNSCRSQMAEGWARRLKSETIDAWSAGTEAHGLNPLAVKVMGEAGVDISDYRSKRVQELPDLSFDCVVTVCGHADEHCPILPAGTIKLHWPLADPAKATGTDDEISAIFCATRDNIRSRVLALIS